MKKSILCMVLGLLTISYVTTAQKTGYINTNELLAAMPETRKAQEKLQGMQDSLNNSYAEMIKEYRDRDSVIRIDSAKWTPAIKNIKFKEFQDLGESLQNYSNEAQQYLQQKEQELFQPVQKIAREAIQAVAKTNGYSYIFSAEALLVSPPADDILPLVKKYLKIGDAPAPSKGK
jgi:outer membrane protein